MIKLQSYPETKFQGFIEIDIIGGKITKLSVI